MNINEDDTVIAAWAEPAAGPGWANTPVLVLVRAQSGATRIEFIQPDEQSAEIHSLYAVSSAAMGSMVRAVNRVRRER